MTMIYGFATNEWKKAKEEMRDILIQVAKQRSMIAYFELAVRIKTVKIEPHNPALWAMLGEISTEEDALGRGMLSVLVVHKSGDMQPGPGFFELAKSLGRNTSDILACWVNEFKKVWAYWAKE